MLTHLLCGSSFSVHQTFNSKKNLIWYSKMKISKQNSFFFYEKTKYINNESIVLMGRTNLNFPNLETLQRSIAHIENFEFVFTAKKPNIEPPSLKKVYQKFLNFKQSSTSINIRMKVPLITNTIMFRIT